MHNQNLVLHKLCDLLYVEVYPSTKSIVPSTDPASLSADLQKDLEQQLRFNLNDIKAKYTLFVECIRTAIKELGTSVGDLRAFLLSQSVYDYDNHDIKLFSDRKAELEGFIEVDQIFC